MTKPNIHAVHRDWDRDFPVIVRTEGIYLYDEHGRRYIDGSGGSSVVTSLGHGVAEIPQAMYDQAQKFSFYPAHAFTNQPFLDLCDLIVSLAPGELRDNSRVWITCTGTDATDDAVRLARQYWVESGQPFEVPGDQPVAGVSRQQCGGGRLLRADRAAQDLPADVRRLAAHPARLLLPLRLRANLPGVQSPLRPRVGDGDPPAGAGKRRRLHRGAGGRARHWAACPRPTATSRRSARSATATTCSSSPTR